MPCLADQTDRYKMVGRRKIIFQPLQYQIYLKSARIPGILKIYTRRKK